MGWDSASEHSSDDEEQTTNAVSYVLITIDCDELMFQKDEGNDECTFKIVLRSCYEVLEHQLMKGGKHGVTPVAIAIVSEDIDKMAICDFNDHLPTSVKKLRELCEMSDKELEAQYKQHNTLQLSHFFLNCKRKLGECGQENTKYIAYISKKDNPIGEDDNERRMCVNQARTFKDFHIYIEILTFNALFEYETFFKEILEIANCKFNFQYFADTIGLKEKILSLLIYRGNRALFFPFNHDQYRKNFFEVIEKRYIKHHKFLNNVSVTKDTNVQVKEIARGGEPKDTYSLQYSTCQDPISFTVEERNIMVYDGNSVGFSLLGTTKCSMLEEGLHSSDPTFIQKNKRINCPHFDIFWQYCVDKNSKLICARKYKQDGPTKLVQLIPKLINSIRSFLVLGIPYCSDIHYQEIHNPYYKSKPTDNVNIVAAAENMVHALDFRYDPLKIHDTVNCKKWEYLRAELLEEKSRPISDVLELNFIEKDVLDVVKEFQELTTITGTKRKGNYASKAKNKKLN